MTQSEGVGLITVAALVVVLLVGWWAPTKKGDE